MDIDRLVKHVFTEALHQRLEEFLFHRGNRGIVVTALAEERVNAHLYVANYVEA